MSGKRHLLISTCGFYTAKNNDDSVTKLCDHGCGAGQYESIFCGQGELFRVPELKARTDEYLECVRQAGREYAQKQAISEGTKEKLRELLYPRDVFEKMADASWGVGKKSGEKEDPVLTFITKTASTKKSACWKSAIQIWEKHGRSCSEKTAARCWMQAAGRQRR